MTVRFATAACGSIAAPPGLACGLEFTSTTLQGCGGELSSQKGGRSPSYEPPAGDDKGVSQGTTGRPPSMWAAKPLLHRLDPLWPPTQPVGFAADMGRGISRPPV